MIHVWQKHFSLVAVFVGNWVWDFSQGEVWFHFEMQTVGVGTFDFED
jgi:hypothetical protein